MTQYVKMFLDWNHAEFNNPVTYNTGKYQTTCNTSGGGSSSSSDIPTAG